MFLAEHKRIDKEESLRQAFMTLANVFAYSTWDSSAGGDARDIWALQPRPRHVSSASHKRV